MCSPNTQDILLRCGCLVLYLCSWQQTQNSLFKNLNSIQPQLCSIFLPFFPSPFSPSFANISVIYCVHPFSKTSSVKQEEWNIDFTIRKTRWMSLREESELFLAWKEFNNSWLWQWKTYLAQISCKYINVPAAASKYVNKWIHWTYLKASSHTRAIHEYHCSCCSPFPAIEWEVWNTAWEVGHSFWTGQ